MYQNCNGRGEAPQIPTQLRASNEGRLSNSLLPIRVVELQTSLPLILHFWISSILCITLPVLCYL